MAIRLLLAASSLLIAALLVGILFLIAGRWDLPFFWASIALAWGLILAGMLLIDPGLIKERLRPGPGALDKAVIIPLKLLAWAILIFAALDVGRLHWSDTVPPAVQAIGLVGFGAGLGVAVWAMVVNRFFSAVVRLQTDRGHHLVDTGPYRFVRHPGYTGILIGILGVPLALGSWGAVAPAIGIGLLILRRTMIEDGFLHQNLDGYPAYADNVRYRLLPGVW